MSVVTKTIARIAASHVRRWFDDRSGKQMARMSGLKREEVHAALEELEDWADGWIRLVVIANNGWQGLNERHLIGRERSATDYRNAEENCLFFQVDDFSDAQGLRHVHHLHDGHLLAPDGDPDTTDPWVQVLREVWRLNGRKGDVPRELAGVSEELFEALVTSERRPALRPWVQFCDRTVKQLSGEEFIDSRSARSAIGASLPALRLFPDNLLARLNGEAPRRRRFAENVLASMDQTRAGRAIDRDEILSTLDRVEFTDFDGEPLGPGGLESVRSTIREYLSAVGSRTPEGVEFFHWKQLFKSAAKRRGVGDRIADEIEASHPDRQGELAELDVVERLDQRDTLAAQEFLDHESESERASLSDLLSTSLRKAVERIANPRARATTQPLRHLLRLLNAQLDEAGDQSGTIRLEVRVRHGSAEDSDRLSRALFALLYGPTLLDVERGSSGSFGVDPLLTDPSALSEWYDQADDPATEEEPAWADLRLQLRWSEEKGASEFFEWRPSDLPGFVAISSVLSCPGSWHWRSAVDFDEWCAELLAGGTTSATSDTHRPDSPIVEEWLEQRESLLGLMFRDGLSSGAIRQYLEIWEPLLDRVFAERVPEGVSLAAVGDFLSVDVHTDDDDVPTMLATHPIRLRWIGLHLENCSRLLLNVLGRELPLNPVNDELFFDRLEQLSPHEHPPLLCDEDRAYVAVRETGWHERYEIVRTAGETRTEWLSDLDDSSLDELASALGAYVDAHPYTADGIDLLMVIRERGARTVREILTRFLAQRGLLGRRAGMVLTVRILSPASEFGAISDAMSELDDPADRALRDFPPIRVVFYEWERDQLFPSLAAIEMPFDVAVVPNLFSSGARFQESTKDLDQHKGDFEPWIDRPTTREPGGTGAAAKTVSRVLLPEARDQMLPKWCTVNIRHFRGAPVGHVDPGTVDYATLRLSVDAGEAFFGEIHERANWVVTLDAFLGREQIEALDHSPQVISVKTDLGKGGAYTLVTSSQAGRAFVEARLSRRLRRQLAGRLDVDPEIVAAAVYDQARELAPTTLLRAMGLGRTAQELVGLVASRRLTLEFAPFRTGDNGFEVWIALDEWPDWFLSGSASRADLLRITGQWDEDEELEFSATVVEAKLRSSASVAKAQQQVARSVELFRSALAPRAESQHDGAFWRRAVLEAIKEAARPTRGRDPIVFRANVNGTTSEALPSFIEAKIREGHYRLLGVGGVVCTMSDDGVETTSETEQGFLWIRASLGEVARVLDRVAGFSPSEPPPALHEAGPNTPEERRTRRLPRDDDAEVDRSDRHAEEQPSGPSPVGAKGGMSREQITRKYQQILDAFAEVEVEVERDREPFVEGPGFIVFRVRPGPGVTPSKVTSKTEHLQLRLELEAGMQPRSYVDSGAVVFEVPKSEEERYYVSADELWDRTPTSANMLRVAIGEDIYGEPVWLDFSSSDTPHLLIGGITGAGKSVALETILVGLARSYPPEALRFSLVDPKGTELGFLENDPHVNGEIGFYPEDAITLLDRLVEEMDSRYSKMKQARARDIREFNENVDEDQRLPWHIVVLDEFADLTSDREPKSRIERSLQRLAQKARACGIHVIVATQKPSAEVISTTVRSNLGAQLALRVKTASDSRIIMDESGAEALAGNGDAFLKTVGGQTTRLQCAKV